VNDLSFLENYKTVRQKFRPSAPVVARPDPVPLAQVEPPKEAPEFKSVEVYELDSAKTIAALGTRDNRRKLEQDRLRLSEKAIEDGISYRQTLLEGMPPCRPRYKLAVLPILEEYAITWAELFDSSRPLYKSLIRWMIYRALKEEEGSTLIGIAKLCDVDHTSVLHGLKRLAKEEKKDGKCQRTIGGTGEDPWEVRGIFEHQPVAEADCSAIEELGEAERRSA
jgi:hypothetical protein